MENSTLDTFSQVRAWAELISLFCTPFLVLFAAYGLRQLKLTKDQLQTSKEIFRTQSRRAAIEAAVLECRKFSETVIQDSIQLDEFLEKEGINFFKEAEFKKTEDGVEVNLSNVNQDNLKKLSQASAQINKFLNGLEAHALFFLSGVADEEIAFRTNAKTFVKLAEDAFKLFSILGVEKDDAKPIKQLYFRWSGRLQAKELRAEQMRISSKLAKFKEKPISPIGT